jgi:hypothetical protein
MSCSRFVRSVLIVTTSLAWLACGSGGSAGPDAAADCVDDNTRCTGSSFERCVGGSWQVAQQCSAICDDDRGCLTCYPDSRSCNGNDVMQCNSAGTGATVAETCAGELRCSGGACVNLCAQAASSRSYIGCEYYAVDLDNAIEVYARTFLGCPGETTPRNDIPVCYRSSDGDLAGLCDPDDTCPDGYVCQTRNICVLDAAHSPFAVVVSNPHGFPVNVTISNAAGVTRSQEVAAGQVTALFPQTMGFADQSVDRSMQGKLAYRVVADAPIVAYQFNPLDNVGVFSNDGSLLIPTTTWDAEYYVMSWPTLTRRNLPAPNNRNDYNSYLTVVAMMDGTVIEVTPRAATRANGPIAAIGAGETRAFTLDAFDVLNLEAVADGDLTGSRVVSLDPDKPIGVFGGHEAVVVAQSPGPNPAYPNGPCCADHVEEMMFPTSTWGKSFAIARSQVRNSDHDRLRVLAQREGTTVSFTPAPASGTCGTLGPGELCEVKIAVDTALEASEPVLIGHYLESVIWQDFLGFNSIGNGDPSMALAVPVEQFRSDYTILVPAEYGANYIAIAAPATSSVYLDGTDVTGMLAPFAGTYRAGRIPVTAGQHQIACNGGCGITVMGYSDAVSYLFAGGLDLRQIVVD